MGNIYETNEAAQRINDETREERRKIGYAFWSKTEGRWFDSEEIRREKEAIKAAIDAGATMTQPEQPEQPEQPIFSITFSSIEDDEPRIYQHNLIYNGALRRRRIFTLDPSNPIPLAGTVFDPRRYRQIK